MIARVAATVALIGAVVLVALILMSSGSNYTISAQFQDAGGLVPGNLVMIGPAQVGSVKSIGLTPNGLATVKFSVGSDAAPLRQGTVARIYENSLSGIANRYVVLEPGPTTAPAIPDGGVITTANTYSFVSLDQLFDAVNEPTRQGLRNLIQGEAASIEGKVPEARASLPYFAPALSSTSNVTQELVRDEPAFDNLLIQGAKALQTLGSSSQELTQLIANTSATTAAIATQSSSLQQALTLLPPTLNQSTATFTRLRQTLDQLDPLVNASKPATRHLTEFATALNTLTIQSIPTVGALVNLIDNPSGSGDLTTLLEQMPALANVAHTTFPRLTQQMNQSQAQLDYLREYVPDVVAALSNIGQTGANYDANGHYARTQPVFSAFGLNSRNQLTAIPPSDRGRGLHLARKRCPGSAVQRSPDGSAPVQVPGCDVNAVPPGP